MPIDVVIFDCDGVLVLGTLELYDEALTRAIRVVDPAAPDGDIATLRENTRGKSFDNQLRRYLGETRDLSDAIDAYESYIHDPVAFQRIRLLEGADAELRRLLASGKRVALATGMNPSLLDRLFAEDILPDIFESVAKVHDILDSELQKPSPQLLTDLLSSMNVEPARACYVGDAPVDIEMARRAGVMSIAVLTGWMDRAQAEEASPDYILDSMLEVHTIL